MNEVNDTLNFNERRQIDAMCDRFETAWQQDKKPLIENFLNELEHRYQAYLLQELVPLERELRLLAGEVPHFSEYASRFPQHAQILAPCFPSTVGGTKPFPTTDAPTHLGQLLHPTLAGNFNRGETSSVADFPRQFDQYVLLRELGRGGMGIVYEAHDPRLNRIVAIKVMLTSSTQNSIETQRFVAEAKAVAQLDHPGIVSVFEIGETEGHPYFSMAYIKGHSLAHRNQDDDLPPRQAAVLIQQAAEAVSYAHQNGIVHRDLKPANILIDRRGQVKLTDFGLCKQVETKHELTATGQILGTPSYMSPEQARGDHSSIAAGTDIYGLGAVLYALLTGRPPFQSPTTLETILQVLHDEPVAPCKVNRGLERDLETICLKCLAKSVDRRYLSAQDLAADLGRFLNGEPIHARPTGLLERSYRSFRKYPFRIGFALSLATLILLLSIGGPFLALYQTQNALEQSRLRQQAEAAQEQAETANHQAENHLSRAENALLLAEANLTRAYQESYTSQMNLAARDWAQADLLALRERLASTLPAKNGHIDLRRFEWYLWKHRSTGPEQTLQGHMRPLTALSYSSAAQLLATADELGTIRFWDITSAQELFSLPNTVYYFNDLAFSPSGEWLAAAAKEKVEVWNVPTRALTLTLIGHTASVSEIAFSPTGTLIATASHDSTVKIWDAVNGKLLQSFAVPDSAIAALGFSPDGQQLATGGDDRKLRIWDVETGSSEWVSPAQQSQVNSLTYHPQGKQLAFGSSLGRLTLVAITKPTSMEAAATFEILTQLDAHQQSISGLIYGENGTKLYSASYDHTIKIWSTQVVQNPHTLQSSVLRHQRTLKGHSSAVTDLDLVNSLTIVSASADQSAKIWDLSNPEDAYRHLGGHDSSLTTLAYHPSGNLLASGSKDRIIKIWNLQTGEPVRVLTGHTDTIWSLAFSPNGQRLVSASEDKTLRIWDVPHGNHIMTLTGHEDLLTCVSFSPNGRQLASSSWDRTVRLWDADSGESQALLRGHTDAVTSVAFNSDGTQLASSEYAEGTIRLWNAKTGKLQATLKGHRGGVNHLAYHPTQPWLVSAGVDQTLRLWNLNNQQCLTVLRGHKKTVQGFSLSSDGSRVISYSPDLSVKLWDLNTQQHILSLPGFHCSPYARNLTVFSPNGRHVTTVENYRTILLWGSKEQDADLSPSPE